MESSDLLSHFIMNIFNKTETFELCFKKLVPLFIHCYIFTHGSKSKILPCVLNY